MPRERKTFKYEKVIQEESDQLKLRRKKLAEHFKETPEDFEETKFGIALSGGGIRSSTINLGLLKTFNMYDILRRADYLSTVSGGGYTGAYIQTMLKEKGDYKELFADDHIHFMRTNGEYLVPGQTVLTKFWNTLVLIVGYLASLIMSLLSPVIMIGILLVGYRLLDMFVLNNEVTNNPFIWYLGVLWKYFAPAMLVVLIIHFLANLIVKFSIKISHFFNILETLIVGAAIVLFIPVLIIYFTQGQDFKGWILKDAPITTSVAIMFGLIILGFFTNPNALSFHRFYRAQLARAFLGKALSFRNIKIKDLFRINENASLRDWIAPYPLINTCLNLQNISGDEEFKGTKANDYFLLSPLYCGAKLTGYVKTAEFPGYDVMSLPAATTISAAALNPGMGIYSSKWLSILMTIFNARLGYWVNNPLKKNSPFAVWWPLYFFYELASKMGSNNYKVNISDGGHIENLGVYELLRRRCRLIIAIDAGADPDFSFFDLENLTIRARNELGLELSFRRDMIPENFMRVRPSSGYSEKRFAVADVYQIWDEFKLYDEEGTLILDDGGEEEEPQALEVLVNYMPDGELIPKVYLKGKLNPLRYQELSEMALKQVNDELASKPGTGKQKLKIGTLVYVKSSITAPSLKPNIRSFRPKTKDLSLFDKGKNFLSSFFQAPDTTNRDYTYDTYKYKIYHPAFPHESTADQFFDPVQWESYYQLGQWIAADVIGIKSNHFLKVCSGEAEAHQFTVSELIEYFDTLGVEAPPAFVRAHKPEPETIERSRSLEEEVVPEEKVIEPEKDIGYRM